MTQQLYIDGFAGVAGNMMLAALLDAGAPPAVLDDTVAALGLDDVRVVRREVKKRGIAALHLDVAHGEHHPHRGLSDVLAVADRAKLPPRAAARVARTFRALAEAEAAVHGVTVEDVHFHEVGAVDAIVDVVGTAALLEALDVSVVGCGPVRTGRGTVTCAHGVLPVPAPATARLLAGVPCFAGDDDGEFCTPTGAALLHGLEAGHGPRPAFVHTAVGHGAGTREPSFANVLRVFVGPAAPALLDVTRQRVVELRTDIDDMSPEALAALVDRLRSHRALDVGVVGLAMKKGRPGQTVQVLCAPEDEAGLVQQLLRHSSTLGVRRQELERWVRDRTPATVHTRFGPIGGKRVTDGRFFPEFEDCRAAAETHGVSVDEVMAAAKVAKND